MSILLSWVVLLSFALRAWFFFLPFKKSPQLTLAGHFLTPTTKVARFKPWLMNLFNICETRKRPYSWRRKKFFKWSCFLPKTLDFNGESTGDEARSKLFGMTLEICVTRSDVVGSHHIRARWLERNFVDILSIHGRGVYRSKLVLRLSLCLKDFPLSDVSKRNNMYCCSQGFSTKVFLIFIFLLQV